MLINSFFCLIHSNFCCFCSPIYLMFTYILISQLMNCGKWRWSPLNEWDIFYNRHLQITTVCIYFFFFLEFYFSYFFCFYICFHKKTHTHTFLNYSNHIVRGKNRVCFFKLIGFIFSFSYDNIQQFFLCQFIRMYFIKFLLIVFV